MSDYYIDDYGFKTVVRRVDNDEVSNSAEARDLLHGTSLDNYYSYVPLKDRFPHLTTDEILNRYGEVIYCEI
jgi:hypothetical protein